MLSSQAGSGGVKMKNRLRMPGGGRTQAEIAEIGTHECGPPLSVAFRTGPVGRGVRKRLEPQAVHVRVGRDTPEFSE